MRELSNRKKRFQKPDGGGDCRPTCVPSSGGCRRGSGCAKCRIHDRSIRNHALRPPLRIDRFFRDNQNGRGIVRGMLYPQYRKPNGEPNTFRELKDVGENELRSIVRELKEVADKLWKEQKAEEIKIDKMNAGKLKAGERIWYLGVPSYEKIYRKLDDVRCTLYPYEKAVEKLDKVARAKARDEKKNSKMAEEQRIKELASALRKNLIPVEEALADSIIERKMNRLQEDINYFKQFKNRIELIRTREGVTSAEQIEKGILDEWDFRKNYSYGFDFACDEQFRSCGKGTVKKTSGVEKRIEKDSKDYAKSACDSFACKIVRRTEEVIEAGRLGTSEKIVKTAYVGAVNPWAGGKVIVTTNNGKYVWITKVILNFSKLGNPFNQWPTRLEGSDKSYDL